jgi:hypothetical protein
MFRRNRRNATFALPPHLRGDGVRCVPATALLPWR